MDIFITKFLEQFALIRTAPAPHIIFAALIAGAIWWAMDWRYGGVIANRDSQITLLTSQRDDYRDKLNGASPDQAKQKIESLEKTLFDVQRQLAETNSIKNRIRRLFDTIDPQINHQIDRGAPRLIVRMQPDDIRNLKKLLDEAGASSPIGIIQIGPSMIDQSLNNGSLGTSASVHEQQQVDLNISPALRN